ncbi:MAG: response regulator transcription factor [Burkholderiales bacterium]|jgi:DNA-binding NarL/FixJ family response regulator|nr:response regulator transcription factor [Burkholderiales bacterium]
MPLPIKVSIVEDDADTRARIAQSVRADRELQLVGEYGVAGEALTGLARQSPDVLLVDLGLPDMPGLDLIRVCAKLYPDCEILVFTAFGDEAHVLAALEAGAGGYLLKGNLSHDIGFDIRDIKAGGSPVSPLIARHLLARMGNAKPAASQKEGECALLTPRETEILNTISRGYTYAETAKLMGVSATTVHTHLKRVYRKLSVSSKTEAIFEASRMGLL